MEACLTEKTLYHKNVRPSLQEELETISEKCTACGLCVKECKFLQRYGTPKEIADAYNPSDKGHQAMPFECSLCGLCVAVCPAKINPATMFIDMRRETVVRGMGDYPEHSVIIGYEKRGTSKRYSFYTIPPGCDTVFFPGCTLPGTRPEKVRTLYEHLKKTIPSLGIVLDCCAKPSYDLGREDSMRAMFQEMNDFLLKNGVRNILVACPNCYKVFNKFGKGLSVRTVYEAMAESGLPETERVNSVVTIHDPCPIRFEESIHVAVRHLITQKGLSIEEMPHSRKRTICCGEGGAVGFISPELSKNWTALRKKEAQGRRIITYCAGCANLLGAVTPASHVLDLLFEPSATVAGKAKVSKAPITYWNRLRLKKHVKENLVGAVTRERTFTQGNKKEGGIIKFFLFLLFITAALITVKTTGATRYLEQETLRRWIQGYGGPAPLIYMLVYAIAPAFLMPGLPITIVGGVLFGPFWGVVYTITGSTMGACVAFLISRYLARQWVAEKLKSPRWQKLDKGVEQHGWKVVALTRLIPLFPFNLLNYAFGLTKIHFLHYAATTFVCMLPACIAYIVFSSSLLDVIKGRISPAFVTGLLLIISVSLLPFLYRKYKAKKGISGSL